MTLGRPMRIGYCGHPHHRTTGSSRFILEALRTLGVVEDHSALPAQGPAPDLAPLLEGGYDAVVVWQVEQVALQLAQACLPNVTFFPMYDSCHAYPDSYWRRLSDLKVLSFSSALHGRLQRLGVRVRFARYYPEVPPERVADREDLAGYLWQRHRDVTWNSIQPLLGDAPFASFTLHDALDPSQGSFDPPAIDQRRGMEPRVTRWFPSREAAQAELLSHNVYFAPRLREGIGLSFLEAMALGFLVVAPDRPTMNEYVASGVNGLLYDPAAPRPLSFAGHRRMGRRARESVEAGRERWCRMLPALLELVATPTREVPVQAPVTALDPLSLERGPGALSPGIGSCWDAAPARVTVAVLGGRGGEADRSATLQSILAQEGLGLELLLFGDARELSRELQLAGAHGLKRCRILPPTERPFDLAVENATGEYLLHLAPGERLLGRDTLHGMLRQASPGADLIVGDHVLLDQDGIEEVRQAADPALAYDALQRGRIGWDWIGSMPPRAAVLWRRAFLREHALRGAASDLSHEEGLLRAGSEGARVHHALMPVTVSPERRRSMRERRRLLGAWQAMSSPYTADPEALAGAFARMRAECGTRDLPRLAWPDLLLALGAEGAFRELKRRIRTRSALHRAYAEDRPSRQGRR